MKQPFVECIANGMHEPAKLCPSEKKPDISTIDPVSCNPHQCNPYSWVTTKGVCSVSCGHGKIQICMHNIQKGVQCCSTDVSRLLLLLLLLLLQLHFIVVVVVCLSWCICLSVCLWEFGCFCMPVSLLIYIKYRKILNVNPPNVGPCKLTQTSF